MPIPRALRPAGMVDLHPSWSESVHNLGVITPLAETDGGPNARRRHGPGRASRLRQRFAPSASNERLSGTSACRPWTRDGEPWPDVPAGYTSGPASDQPVAAGAQSAVAQGSALKQQADAILAGVLAIMPPGGGR
jgi:hypothetical protein